MSYPYYSTRQRFAGLSNKIGFTILQNRNDHKDIKIRVDVIVLNKKRSFMIKNAESLIDKVKALTTEKDIITDAIALSRIWSDYYTQYTFKVTVAESAHHKRLKLPSAGAAESQPAPLSVKPLFQQLEFQF